MSKKASKKKKVESDDESYNDDGEFANSEDEYISPLEESEEEDEQAGGEADGDDDHLDIDPDEEKADYNEDDAEEYDPVEHEELADEDAEVENEDEVEAEEGEEFEGEEEVAVEAGEMEEEGAAPAKVCHVKNLNKEIIMDEDDSAQYAKLDYVRVPDEERMTDPIMSYYELVRVLGTRAQQFNFGAIPLVDGLEGLHPAKKAYVELIAKMTPFIIRRHLPGKRYEEWKVDELEQIHVVDDDFFVPDNLDLSKILGKKKK